jgi:Secretion system C-terminal sorting domain
MKVITVSGRSARPVSLALLRVTVCQPGDGKMYLHDKYLHKYKPLEPGAEYKFSVTADSATQGERRFELGMGNMPGNNGAALANLALSLTTTPNPAKEMVTVRFNAPTAENTSLRILDVSGATIYSMNLGIRQNGSVEIPIDKLPSGVYMIEFNSGSQQMTQRLVKD